MLITRCPHCETAFRIQAAHLEQAEGHVRCGRCANVFDAYQELRQSLSPTLTDLAENSAEPSGAESATTDSQSEFSSAEVDELEQALDPEADAAAGSAFDEADIPPTVTDEEVIEEAAVDEAQKAGSEKQRLEFNLPADQWQDFFADTIVGEGEVPAISDTGVEWVVLGETDIDGDPVAGSAEATEEPEANQQDEPSAEAVAKSAGEPEQHSDDGAEGPAGEATESDATGDTIDRDLEPDGHVMDLTAVAEQTLTTAEPDPESALVEGLFRDLEEKPLLETRGKTNHWYSGAALLLIVMLCGQYVHYNRQSLATHVNIGPWLINGYSRLGIEINPDWNLDQYQINRWVAASDNNDTENPSLKITAQITNRGPKAQPYPLVQLALKDRWDETVAGRVFEPAEYLSQGTAGGLLAPGDHIQAELKVLDPGQDAYGFELDVCMRTENQRLQCANEPRR